MTQKDSASTLLTQGIAATRAGDHEEAKRLLRRATELDPKNVDAWIWRASVVENSADKKSFLAEALTLDPQNADATLALERIQELEGNRNARIDEDDTLYCTVHPDRETMLRCNRCGRPMCPECSVRHPVGLRCRDCVNETRSPIYKVNVGTSAKIFLTSFAISVPVATLVLTLGNFIFFLGIFFALIIGFMLGGAVGRTVGEIIQRVIPRKRGRPVQMAVAGGMLSGLLIATIGVLLVTGSFPNIFLILLYLGTAIPSAAASLR